MANVVKVLKHHATIFLLAIIGLVVFFLLIAPPAIRFFGTNWLREHGASHAQIANVRLNPFTGTLVLHEIKASDNLKIGKLGIDIDWLPLWNHTIFIRKIDIENSNLGLTTDKEGRWKIKGLNIPPYDNSDKSASNTKTQSWHPLLNAATLKNVHIQLNSPDLTADIPVDSLRMNHAYMLNQTNQVLNVQLRLGKAMVGSPGYKLSDAGLRVQGQFTVPGPNTLFSSKRMTLEASNLSVDDKAAALALSIDHIHASGASLQGTSSFKAAGIKVKMLKLGGTRNKSSNKTNRINLTTIRGVTIHKFSVFGTNKASFALIDLKNASLPATEKESLGSIGNLKLSDCNIAPGNISLNQVAFDGLNLNLEHKKSGMAVLSQLKSVLTPSTAPIKASAPPIKNTNVAPSSSSERPHIYIGLITVNKGSKISFRDSSIDPQFHTVLQVNKMSISSLDTSGRKTGTLDTVMRIGDQGKLSMNGKVKLHGYKPDAKISLAVKRFSMPALTGYMKKDFGSAIKTGQMDLISKFGLNGDTIDSKNKLDIRNLKLENLPQPSKSAQSLGMPLNTAVDMLRDDKGDISLNVPIKGRLDDPKFGLNDAIDKALMSAMRSAAVSYAALLLQPYGSILPALSFAKDVIGHASKPRLTPITFGPDTAILSPNAKGYITKITGLLKKKPFRLQVCGVASLFEMKPSSKATPTTEGTPPTTKVNKVQNDRMLSLAKARSVAVIKAIVSGGISADRVFNCLPTIDRKPKATGRVELLLN